MTINELLELLSKKQLTWIKMVKSFGASQEVAEDQVQEMYLRMYDLVKDPDRVMFNETEVNTQFVYTLLRNRYFTRLNNENKIDTNVDVYKYEALDKQYDIERDYRLHDLVELIEKEVNTWEWYDTKIYNLYYKEGYNLRVLSEETGICITSIYNTIKNCRIKIRNKFGNIYYS